MTRLKDLTDQFRRTLSVGAVQQALLLTEEELTQSAKVLRVAGEHAAVATSLIKQGNIRRMLDDHGRAIAAYTEALTAAERAGDKRQQAESLSGKAKAEFSRGQLDQAMRDAEQAVPLALASGQKDALSSAYGSARPLTYGMPARASLSSASLQATARPWRP